MALKLVNPTGNPLGQFDGKDSEVLTLKGGEVVTFAGVAASASDQAAADSLDGYVNPSGTSNRPYVTKTLADTSRPLMLADDGVSGYGTLFGTVVGGTVGQVAYGPNSVVAAANLLGPHTATASGKVTCWHAPGVYAVSLDACTTSSSTGLQPTNTSLSVGTGLTYTAAGLLTPAGGSGAVSGAPNVGNLIDFEGNGSLVSTPKKFVEVLTNPLSFSFAVFYFNPPTS